MAYNKKTWLARLGQGLNKFIFNGGSRVTLESSPDLVTQEGTPLSADNMNDLESRIDSEFTNVNDAITSLSSGDTSYTWTFDTTKVTNGDGTIVVYGGHLVVASIVVEPTSSLSASTAFASVPSALKPKSTALSLFCINYNPNNDTVSTVRGAYGAINTSGQVYQAFGSVGVGNRLLMLFVYVI